MDSLRSHRHEIVCVVMLLLLAAGVRLPGLFSRSIWRDEAVTLLETAGYASPSWPKEPTPARVIQKQFEGAPNFSKIAEDLRRTDVHPPVYFWLLSLWRQWLGFSLKTARIFSLIFSLGTIFVLYLLLRFGKIEYPLVPTTVYALSSGAVYYGHEARSYALATFFLTTGALFAYLASEEAWRKKARATTWAMAMAICCGVTFYTHYLTLFPICVIFGWFVVSLWSVSRTIALVVPLVTVGLGSIGFSTLLLQLGARPHLLIGFVGFAAEIKELLYLNLCVLWAPNAFSQSLTVWVWGGLAFLIGLTLVQLLRHWQTTNRKLWLLLFGLAGAPSLGVLLVDLLFNKHLHQFSYLIFAGPTLAVIAAYGITKLISSQRYMGIGLLVLLWGLQLVNNNWGYAKGLRSHPGIDMRILASIIKTSSSPSHLVVIGGGFGRGFPASVIYELEPETMIVVLEAENNLGELQANIQDYDDVWFVFSVDGVTTDIEQSFLNTLQSSGHYREVFREWPAIHLRKEEHIAFWQTQGSHKELYFIQ